MSLVIEEKDLGKLLVGSACTLNAPFTHLHTKTHSHKWSARVRVEALAVVDVLLGNHTE